MNIKTYDAIVVGCGFAGAVTANILSEKQNKKVLIVEKRNHIGGNCYDEKDEYGVLIHKYGPHIFHTNSKKVFEYLSEYTEWYDYSHEVVAKVGDEYIPVPFNLNSLKKVYGENCAKVLANKLIDQYEYGRKVPILELRNSSDEDVRGIADYVYENVFLKYTMKQWGQTPEQIDPAVTARVPVLVSDDNRYFQDTYQGMPKDGYTKVFEKMLDNPNITVMLGQDAAECIEFDDNGIKVFDQYFIGDIIFTGPIDELFGCRYGRLPYRTLKFEFEHKDEDSYQPNAVVNYTVSEDYTRITEYKKLTGQIIDGTTIMREYPMAYTGEDGQIPYYSIINDENVELYNKYVTLVKKYRNFHLLGRLAEYKYYNIDAIVEKAMELAERLA
ncbi:MAG: UDP-galactopyranose mutase [Lachnospiraceae bacterium]|nr:UDP-galactopyranose mutase [Lachnospiraceae bacterium]